VGGQVQQQQQQGRLPPMDEVREKRGNVRRMDMFPIALYDNKNNL